MDELLQRTLFSKDLPPTVIAELSSLLEGILAALPDPLSIVDESGVIVAVNRAWRAFMEVNGVNDPAYGIGKSYLSVWATQTGSDSDLVRSAGEGLRQVLAEESSTFTLEYPAHNAHQRRWSLMRASGLRANGKRYAVLLHEDITQQVLAEEPVQSLTQFPAENPNPVMRMAIDGQILYANNAAVSVLNSWGRDAEGKVLEPWRERLRKALDLTQVMRLEVASGERTYLLEVVPIAASSCVNVYGCDITEVKCAEQKSAEFAAIVQSSQDAIIGKDLNGIITSWNQGAERMYGYSEKEVVGKSVSILIPPDRVEEMSRILEKIRRGEPVEAYESIRLTKSGTSLPVSLSVSPVLDAQGRTVAAATIARDISERQRAEERLRESEERYRSLFETMLNGFAYCQMEFDQGRPRDFIYLGVNPAFETQTGLKNVVGKKVSEVIPGIRETDPQLFEIYGRVALTGKPEQFETYVEALGMWFSIAVYSPQKEYFVAVFDVITTRKQAEAALRALNADLERQVVERTARYQRAKERTEAILDSSSDAIILCRTDGSIDQANQAFDTIFGRGANEVLNQPLTSLLIPHDVPVQERAFSALLATRQPQRFEVTIQQRDGATFAADVMLSPVIGQDFTLAGVVCILRDITERKQMEANLREALMKEKDLNVLKTRFTSMVSHDIRTPLSIISSSAEILHDYYDRMDEAMRAQHFDRIGTQVERMVELLTDVLTLNRADAGATPFNPISLDLNLYCRRLIEEFQSNPRMEHVLIYTAPDGPVPTPADEKLLYQALTNLLRNALKYSPEGSTIHLDLTREEHEVILRIADSGIGIPKTDLPHLFEPFHRASNVGQIEGTGLGLAIVQRSIAAHGGTIRCESQVGVGTTFTVRLPKAVRTEGGST